MNYTSLQFLTTVGNLGHSGVASIKFVSGARNAIGSTADEFVSSVYSCASRSNLGSATQYSARNEWSVTSRFAVLLADDFIVADGAGVTADIVRAFVATGKSQLSVMQVAGADISKYGDVVTGPDEGSVLGLIEKPKFEDAPSDLASIGRYVLTPDIFEILHQQKPGAGSEIQLADAINQQALNGLVYSTRLNGKRYDCGSKQRYQEAYLYYIQQKMLET